MRRILLEIDRMKKTTTNTTLRKFIIAVIYLFGILLFSFTCNAQQKTSIEKKSKNSFSKRENSISPLISKAEAIMDKDPEGAVEIIELALTESIETGDRYYEAQSYRVLGAINLKSNLNELALKNSLKSFQLLSELKNETALSKVRIQLADCYDQAGNLEEALRLYKEQLELYKNYISEAEALKVKYKIAGIYTKQGKKNQAISDYKEILKEEQTKDNKSGIVKANKKIGEVYEQQSNNQQALEYYNRAQTIAENSNDIKSINSVNENISSILKKEKKYDQEINVRKRSLDISIQKNDIVSENIENIAIAKTYIDTKRPEEAIPYLNRSLELIGKNGQLEEKAEVYRQLSSAYALKNNYTKSMEFYQNYVTLKDSILLKKERALELALSSNLSLTEKQKQIELLEKNIELNQQKIEVLTSEQTAKEERLSRQMVIIYALIVGILIIVAASYLLYKNAQKRRIANQLLALKSLRSQMNPHFIFNALNSVNSFISKNDEKSANKYLSDFSKLMRMVMENSQEDFVSLTAEINILELYLGLEHFRFSEKFDYTFTVDEEIDKDAFEIPPMLIQPYIENAVWHGLRYKEKKGKLSISFQLLANNQLQVTIEDDGVGRKKSAELKTNNQKMGNSTGIKNTVNRVSIINEIYKKNILITIEDLFHDKEDSGTRVIILLPGKISKPI